MLRLSEELADVKSVAISGHVRPDGDCVGSTLAVYNYIRQYFPNVEVELYLDPIPNIFKFLKNSDKIVHDRTANRIYDLFIALDCGDAGRLGDSARYFETAKRTLCIDHHISNSSFADVNYIYPEVSSTCELVFGVMETERITREIAECIYLGMVHDTGVFQYSSTSAATMNIAGQLMEMGIDFTKIVDDTFYKKTYEQNRITGQALVDSKLYLDGKVITTVVTLDEMKQFQVLPKHLEGIVQQLRVTNGVEAALFLYEMEEQNDRQEPIISFKVSMRSNGLVDVAAILMKFGGGGHVRAAGATMYGTADEVIGEIVAAVEAQLSQKIS